METILVIRINKVDLSPKAEDFLTYKIKIMKLPENLLKILLEEIRQIASDNIHGYGYLPFKIASRLGFISEKSIEIRKQFPEFNGVLDPNKELTITIRYGEEFFEYKLSNDFKTY